MADAKKKKPASKPVKESGPLPAMRRAVAEARKPRKK